MSEKTVPVVVTASGKFELGFDSAESSDMTVGVLIEHAAEQWGIDLEEVEQPFVVIADISFGGHEILDVETVVREKLKENDMLRVVFPLKAKD